PAASNHVPYTAAFRSGTAGDRVVRASGACAKSGAAVVGRLPVPDTGRTWSCGRVVRPPVVARAVGGRGGILGHSGRAVEIFRPLGWLAEGKYCVFHGVVS